MKKTRVRRLRRARGILRKPMPPNPADDRELESRIAAALEFYGANTAQELLLAMLAERFPAFRTEQPPAASNDPIKAKVDAIIESVFPAIRPEGRPPVFTEIGLGIAESRRRKLIERNPRLSEVEICRHILAQNTDFDCIGWGTPKTLARLLSERRRKLRKKDSATKP